MALFDDLPAKPQDPVQLLAKQDLDDFSQEDLRERIEMLEQEIARVRNALDNKGASQAAAEAFFKS